MEQKATEEKAPLLLYLSEASEGTASINNKRINFEKGRLYGISSGATAVFTEIPNLFSTCWLTTVISALVFFLMFVLMFSSLHNNTNYIRVPRCIHKSNSSFDNSTVHLVHEAKEWNSNEIEILERIIDKFPGYKIHILVIDTVKPRGSAPPTTKNRNLPKATYLPTPLANTNHTQPLNKSNHTSSNSGHEISRKPFGALGKILRYRPLKRVKRKKIDDGFSSGVKRFLDLLFIGGEFNISGSLADARFPTEKPKPKYAMDFPNYYPNVVVERATYKSAFHRSPLEHTWTHLNHHLTMFAARILQLWEYGGMTFCLHGNNNGKSDVTAVESFSIFPEATSFACQTTHHVNTKANLLNNQLFNFIDSGLVTFEHMPVGVVTSDEDGLHIFSKIPCHAFFGEVLLKLKKAKKNDTVKNIIKQSLAVFCQHSATRKQYCQTLIQKINEK